MKVIVESLAEEITEVIGESLVVVLVQAKRTSTQRAIPSHHSATAHGSSLNFSVGEEVGLGRHTVSPPEVAHLHILA